VKPSPFAYHRPADVPEAADVLARLGDDAKVLAGGQSLIPILNMRLAAPAALVDINGLRELAYVRSEEDGVRVGALARHCDVERDPDAARVQPLLRRAVRLVAHPTIRNRGTVVGSLAHADPAAELTAVLALLGGLVQLAAAGGRRTVGAAEFFLGPLESAVAPGELAVEAFFPALPPRSGSAFVEVARRHGDYAMCGVGATVTLDGAGTVSRARLAFISMAGTPVVVDVSETGGDWEAAVRLADARLDPEGDIHASAHYRRHLARVLTARALRAAEADARAGAEEEQEAR
jgi:carbon-monoxide dehydrogenase medium subunit